MGAEIRRRTKSLRVKSGRKSGGQPGHEGNTRLRIDSPEGTETHQPNFCRECGRVLSDVCGHLEAEQECVGFRIIPVTTRHRYLSKTCTCGCCNRIEVPKRRNPVYFSRDVRAPVVYLNAVMCMPFNRIRCFLEDVMHIGLSEGSIGNFLEASGKKADKICGRISDELVKGKVAGADESGIYVDGRLKWGWILQNPRLTLTWIAKGRGAKEMTGKFGGDAFKDMVLTSDRHSAYFALKVKGHQVCIPHLLRNLNYLDELDTGQDWSSRLKELLKTAVHWRNENPGQPTSSKNWIESLDKLLNRATASQ